MTDKVPDWREYISELIDDLGEWWRRVQAATIKPLGEPLGPALMIPDVPRDFVDRAEVILDAFGSEGLPVLAEFCKDPDGPEINDVIEELGRALSLTPRA